MGEVVFETEIERWRRICDDHNSIDILCENLSCGSTLVDMAENWNVNFGRLVSWINGSIERKVKVDAALAYRDEWEKEIVMRELKRLGQSSLRDLLDERGAVKNPLDWSEQAARSVASIKVKELYDGEGNKVGELKDVKFWDKTKSLELIGKKHKLFVDKHEHGLSKTLEQLVSESHKE